MNNTYRIETIQDLQRLCDEGAEETTSLEFKSCSELKIGSEFWDKATSQKRNRTREDVLIELTKDVTAFLNAAGGIIIYGIQERKSRAEKIDKKNAFKHGSRDDNVRPEKVIDWLRAHILPRPNVDVYPVFENAQDPKSPWFLIIDVPQGATAYQAKDLRFYRRIGSTVMPMEQYEVFDVMNRTTVPDAEGDIVKCCGSRLKKRRHSER